MRSQIKATTVDISQKTKQANNLSLSYKSKLEKQNWFYEKFSNYYDLVGDTIFNTRYKLWKRLDYLALNDSINHKWEQVWDNDLLEFNKEIGFSNPEAFHSFIEENRISKIDSSNYDSSLAITAEIAALSKSKNDNESKILSYNEQTKFGLNASMMFFIILFGFRYFFYSLKWSFITLNQKSE